MSKHTKYINAFGDTKRQRSMLFKSSKKILGEKRCASLCALGRGKQGVSLPKGSGNMRWEPE